MNTHWRFKLKKALIDFEAGKITEDDVELLIESLLKEQRENCADKFSTIPLVKNGFMDYEIGQIKEKILNAPPPTGREE